MKLRTYLLLANSMSIAFIIIVLVAFYRYMLLSMEQFVWLSTATMGAGVVSALLHFLFMRPLEASVRRVKEGAAQIAAGDLKARIDHTGLVEFKQLADQFNHMGSSLEHSFQQVKAAESAQRELVANMAHDLRTPLASVQSYVEALEDDIIQDDQTFRKYLSTIRTETVRLGHFIQDLFELSTLDGIKKESDELQLSVVEDVLVDLLPGFTKPIENKSLDFIVKLPDYPVSVHITPKHLQRILQNLLENAIRHTPIKGMLTLSVEEVEDELVNLIRFKISDEGEGVPACEREKIFERFYRSDRSRSREGGGAGLGLSIAKLLVEQYEGQIGIQEASGQGSVFWFTLKEAAKKAGTKTG